MTSERLWYGLLGLVVVLMVWELLGRSVNPIFLSYPSAVLLALAHLTFGTGELVTALLTTLAELAVGMLLAVPLGVVLGLLIGSSRRLDYLLTPWVDAIYATPRIVFVPLVVLWFGILFQAKVVFVVLMAVFPLLMNTAAGVKSVDSAHIELARSFGARRSQIVRTIVLPAAWPHILVGTRLALGMGIIGVILAEMFTAMTGVGYLLVSYGNRLQTDRLFAVIVVIGLIAILLNRGLDLLARKTAPWWGASEEA